MLKKKDLKKPFWKRLIKSTEKVNFSSTILLFISLFQSPWIVVDWNHFTAEGKFHSSKKTKRKFFKLDDEEGLDGAPGKDWSNLGKPSSSTNIFYSNIIF
jgi:hypothetical protein